MSNVSNPPAASVSYYTPAQYPPAGTAINPQPDLKPIPTLFQPIEIRGVEFQNRIFVAPLCQYSADDGALTAWHIAHLGGILMRGPGLTMIEATAVTPEGRITPQDAGLWSDHQIEPLRKIVEFAHSQGQKIGIQLAHAGRKASTIAPWLGPPCYATSVAGGWPDNVWGPTTEPFEPRLAQPKAMSQRQIEAVVKDFANAAKRAVQAGIDVIEIHCQHGFLLQQFLSLLSNKRSDEYGGSFQNRIRFTLEVVDAVRSVIPPGMPLFVRLSGTEWMEEEFPNEGWKIEDTVRLAGILAGHGVDLIDVSSGGGHQSQSKNRGPLLHETAFQTHLAEAVKRAHGDRLLVSAVGGINTGLVAQEVLDKGHADVVMVGRQFQKDPGTVWAFAEQLGVEIKLANQIGWGFVGRTRS